MERQIAKARSAGARPGLIRPRYASDARLAALIRGGDVKAFETLYDRYSHDVLLFCGSIVHSRSDAEDALQATFVSAFRSLPSDEREIELRRWLFVVARNASLSILRRRTSTQQVEDSLLPPAPDAAEVAERREGLEELLAAIKQLPENQRTSLVLAELLDMSHAEIGAVIDVPTAKVKAFVHQARLTLAAERQAIGADCAEIRRELEGARGAGLLKGHLRRHLRRCEGCSDYAKAVRRQRHALGLLLPIAPALGLRHRVLAAAKATQAGFTGSAGGTAGASVVGATADLLGVAGKGLVAKLLIGVAAVGAGAGASAVVVDAVTPPAHSGSRLRLADAGHSHAAVASAASPSSGRGPTYPGPARSQNPAPTGSRRVHQSPSGSSSLPGPAQAGGGRQTHASGKGPPAGASETRGKSSEPHGASAEAPGRSGRPRGKVAEARGRRGEPHGNRGSHGESPESRGKNAGSHAGNSERHGKSPEPHGSAPAAPTLPAGGAPAAPTAPSPAAGPGPGSEPAPERQDAKKTPGDGTGREGAGPPSGKP